MVILERNGRWERDALKDFAEDLCWSCVGALLGVECGESLGQLSVAIALADVGCGEKLLGRRELGGELSAIAAVGAPSFNDGDAENERQGSGDKF